ncbi:DUF397 domain-containing protein [Spirillospora sp. NPDC049652]
MTDEAPWRKSSHSGTEQSTCVELANLSSAIGVRDSKFPEQGHLVLSRSVLADLLREVGGQSDE